MSTVAACPLCWFRTPFPGFSVDIPVFDAAALQSCGGPPLGHLLLVRQVFGSFHAIFFTLILTFCCSARHFVAEPLWFRFWLPPGVPFQMLAVLFLRLMLGADLSDGGWISLSGYLLLLLSFSPRPGHFYLH